MRQAISVPYEPGLWELLRRGCGRATQSVTEYLCGLTRSTMFECACSGAPADAPPCNITFRKGTASDLAALSPGEHEYGVLEKRFGFERLSRGDSLMLGEIGGDVVFYAWLMHAQMDVDVGTLIPLSSDVAYSYKVFTVPRARGLRICHAYYSYIKQCLQAQGHSRLICRITTENTPSIHAHERAGFRPAGRLWRIVIAGHPIYWIDGRLREWLAPISTSGYFSDRGFLTRYEK